MRSTSLATFGICTLVAAGLALVAGCNNTTAPRLYATAAWKMRCPDAPDFMPPASCAMGCTEGQDRIIDGFAGQSGVSVTCNVTETATSRIINFRLANASGQALTFQNVEVPTGGGSALRGTVRLREDNEYIGAAGGTAPSTAQPCQVSNVTFYPEEGSGDPTMRGFILCDTMRASADMRICRGLSQLGGSGTAMNPAEFTIYGCPGLVLSAP